MMGSINDIPADTVSLFDYERRFHERVEASVRAYIAGAAGDSITQHENRSAFDRLRLQPRAFADLSDASTGSILFGEELAYPILIAPTAYHRLVHPEGEKATAKAASLTRTWMTVSTQASTSIEDIAAASAAPLWFQLYFQPRPEQTLSLVERAENAGYRAIVVTVDAVVSGIRNIEQRAGFRLPPGISPVNLEAFDQAPFIETQARAPLLGQIGRLAPGLADLEWLCGQTRLPVLVKGILNPADVAPCLDAGIAGIVVSNHGGRTLDTLPATIDALPSVTAAVNGQVPVLLDGGVRRGTDIVKALALGASAVMIGQPILHALAIGGLAGVAHMLTTLQRELEVSMALLGISKPEQAERSIVFPTVETIVSS